MIAHQTDGVDSPVKNGYSHHVAQSVIRSCTDQRFMESWMQRFQSPFAKYKTIRLIALSINTVDFSIGSVRSTKQMIYEMSHNNSKL